MKYCPTCEARYEEEILRFCMKDGTPLVDEQKPNFIAMPSESLDAAPDDDEDEVTVVRRNPAVPIPPPDLDEDFSFAPKPPSSPRIIVPMTPESASPQRLPSPAYLPPPKPHTLWVVFLTMFGTTALLVIGAVGFWFLQRDAPNNSNSNANLANVNTNVNTNLGLDGNFNFNTNANFATNVNANANLATPSPTPRPSPSPSPSPSPTDTSETPETFTPATPTPSRTPFPTPLPTIIRPGVSPTPPSTPLPTNRPVNGGVLNGRAVKLPTPVYPPLARQMRASGEVRVEVEVDERGNVVSARAVSGNPLLRQSAESAARQSKISPARLDNRNVGLTGVLVYNYRNN